MKNITEKELIIITLQARLWSGFIGLNSMFIFGDLMETFLPQINRTIQISVDLILTLIIMLPLAKWWHKEKYISSYRKFKSEPLTNPWRWKILTIVILIILCTLPFIVMFSLIKIKEGL